MLRLTAAQHVTSPPPFSPLASTALPSAPPASRPSTPVLASGAPPLAHSLNRLDVWMPSTVTLCATRQSQLLHQISRVSLSHVRCMVADRAPLPCPSQGLAYSSLHLARLRLRQCPSPGRQPGRCLRRCRCLPRLTHLAPHAACDDPVISMSDLSQASADAHAHDPI